MKLSEFVLTQSPRGAIGFDSEYFASITVTTGCLWWKRVERRKIRRKVPGAWHFVDTGEFLPDEVRALERAWFAQKSLGEAQG